MPTSTGGQSAHLPAMSHAPVASSSSSRNQLWVPSAAHHGPVGTSAARPLLASGNFQTTDTTTTTTNTIQHPLLPLPSNYHPTFHFNPRPAAGPVFPTPLSAPGYSAAVQYNSIRDNRCTWANRRGSRAPARQRLPETSPATQAIHAPPSATGAVGGGGLPVAPRPLPLYSPQNINNAPCYVGQVARMPPALPLTAVAPLSVPMGMPRGPPMQLPGGGITYVNPPVHGNPTNPPVAPQLSMASHVSHTQYTVQGSAASEWLYLNINHQPRHQG